MATFQISREEFIAASFRLARKRTVRFILLVILLIVAIATSRVIHNDNLLAAAPYALALSIIIPIIRIASKLRLGKTYDDQSSLRETFTVDIASEGVRFSHAHGTRVLPWQQIHHWSEDRRFVYLFDGDLRARVLPKRALSSEESADLRAQLASSPKKKPLSSFIQR